MGPPHQAGNVSAPLATVKLGKVPCAVDFSLFHSCPYLFYTCLFDTSRMLSSCKVIFTLQSLSMKRRPKICDRD